MELIDREEFRGETLRRFARWELPANHNLALIAPEEHLHPPSAATVAKRTAAIAYVIVLAYGAVLSCWH